MIRLTWANSLFWCDAAEAILLGFQHYLLTLGITVLIPSILVPQMGGGNVRIFCFSMFCYNASFLLVDAFV